MNAYTKDSFVFTTLSALMIIWAFHFPYTISPDIVKSFFDSYEKPHTFAIIDLFCLLFVYACFMIFVGKRFLDSKWQQYKIYRICAIFLANATFIFACGVVFALSIAFHCRYYWAIDCADDPEDSTCSNFPIEIDIAYLFQCIPMLFMLVLMIYFAFYNKILSRSNLLWLCLLPFFILISIMICFGGNGVGCYD